MTENSLRAPSLLQARPKAPTTSHASTASATSVISSAKAPDPSPPSTREVPPPRPIETRRQAVDTASDKATTAFIRRTLCSHSVLTGNLTSGEKGRATPKPIDELLPPLTSSNDVDLQLYAIIAVIIKEFVSTWYGKITPDHVFVDEIIQIIAHCTRALEQRLRKVDLEALLLDELPELVDAHVEAYRISHQGFSRKPLASEPRVVYHILHPHPALSPVPVENNPSSALEQQQNEAAWRQLLVQGVLAVLLPTEDLENGCLRVLVTEIFSEMILGRGIADRACESWLLWDAITNIAEVLQPRTRAEVTDERKSASASSETERPMTRLEQYGLLSSKNEDVTTDAKQIDLGRTGGLAGGANAGHEAWSISQLFWLVVQYAFLAFTAVRAVIAALTSAPSLPSRSSPSASSANVPSPISGIDSGASRVSTGKTEAAAGSAALKRPMLSMRLWSCTSNLLELSMRMPWLTGLVSLIHWGAVAGPLLVGGTDGALDRLLSHYIHQYALNPSHIPTALRLVRTTLFPNNTPASARQVPTPEEQIQIKQNCAIAILSLIPERVSKVYFATENRDEWRAEAETMLDLLGDSYLNKHLMFSIVELLVLRLMPELGEKRVGELYEERVGSDDAV